jgi:hypothetical protein
MDPLTAIGLVSNVLSFVDFGWKVLKDAREIYHSSTGTLDKTRYRELLARESRALSSKCIPLNSAKPDPKEAELFALAAECMSIATKLVELLDKIKPTKRTSFGWSLVASLKIHIGSIDREIQELEERLHRCQTHLNLEISFLARLLKLLLPLARFDR